jgi:hypothetical protein
MPTPALEDVLPKPGDGWELESSQKEIPGERGWKGGRLAHYTGPDGVDIWVLIMVPLGGMDSTRAYALNQAEEDWQVVVTYEQYVIAGSTGTHQGTHTPERPIHLEGTPVSGTRDGVVELLSRSPVLNEQYIKENSITPSN